MTEVNGQSCHRSRFLHPGYGRQDSRERVHPQRARLLRARRRGHRHKPRLALFRTPGCVVTRSVAGISEVGRSRSARRLEWPTPAPASHGAPGVHELNVAVEARSPKGLRQLADSRFAARHCSMTFMQASPSANEGAIALPVSTESRIAAVHAVMASAWRSPARSRTRAALWIRRSCERPHERPRCFRSPPPNRE